MILFPNNLSFCHTSALLILVDPTRWFVYPSCLHPPPDPSPRQLRCASCSMSSFQSSPALSQLKRIALTLGNKRKHLADAFCSSFLLPFSCLEFEHSGWILSSHLVTIRRLWSLKHMLRVGKQKDRNWGVDHTSASLTSPSSPTAIYERKLDSLFKPPVDGYPFLQFKCSS